MVNLGKYTIYTWMVWAKWVDNLFMFMVFHSTYLFVFSFYGKCVGLSVLWYIDLHTYHRMKKQIGR